MKYRVTAFRHADDRWEAQYVEIKHSPMHGQLASGTISNAIPFRLQRTFATKDEANAYAKQVLIDKGVDENDTVVR